MMTNRLKRRTGIFALAAMLTTASPGVAKNHRSLLEPSGPWVMNYADDSCQLGRTFGTGADAVTVQFRQFAPSENFELIVAGRAPAMKDLSSFTTEFGPDGKVEQHPSALRGKLPDGRIVLEASARFWPKEKSKSGKSPDEWDADEGLQPLKVDREAEAKITQLRVGSVGVRLGPMDAPMDAMRACLDELLTHWGIDAAAHHSLTRPATPTSNPGRWLTPDDYPTQMLRTERSGVVHFRLMIDTEGKPTACVVQTGGGDFDKLTCELLMKRARFAPALGAAGNPIPSYYSNTAVWIT